MCASALAVGPQGKNPGSAKVPSDFSDPVSKPSIIQTACLKCHGGKSVNGDLDFTQSLTREQRVDAMTKAARGEMPKNGPKLTPPQLSQLQKELGLAKNAGASSAPNQGPPNSGLAKRPASKAHALNATTPVSSTASTSSALPQAHVSIVPPGSDVPVGHVQVVPQVTTKALTLAKGQSNATAVGPKPRPKKFLPPAGLTKDVDKTQQEASKPVEKADAANEGIAKVSDEIKRLAGDWMAVARQGDGELSTIELQLDDHGWAKLITPGSDGKSSTTTRKVELEKNELKLDGANSNPAISLGKLVSVDNHQMVLERSSGLVTFVRP
jgi:hypothetical protein